MIKRQGFTLAEALITMVIISLVMAATMPIVLKSTSSPSEAPFKYIVQGNLAHNAAVYSAVADTATVVLGSNRIPYDKNIAETDLSGVFGTKLNPRLSIVTRNRAASPVISRHLIDFYEKETNNSYTGIGKISFDQFYNMAIGQNTLASIKSVDADAQAVNFVSSTDEDKWNEITYTTTATSIYDESNAEIAGTIYNSIDSTVTKGAANTAIGQYSMAGDKRYLSQTGPTTEMIGSGNTALGAFSMRRIKGGSLNTGLGLYALHNMKDSLKNTAVGAYAMKNPESGAENTAVGTFSMTNMGGTDTRQNTAVGAYSLYSVSGGALNTAIGYGALRHLGNGSANTAIGAASLVTNVIGAYNTAVGYQTLQHSYNGSYNVAVGYQSQQDSKAGRYNISIGAQSLKNGTTGAGNIVIGNTALKLNTTGSLNIVIGSSSCDTSSSANGNIIIGNGLGRNETNFSNKLYIGGVSTLNSATGVLTATRNSASDVLIYGDMSYNDSAQTPSLNFNTLKTTIGLGDSSKTYILGEAYIKKGSSFYQIATKEDIISFLNLSSAGGTGLTVGIPATIYSDARLKNVIGENTAGLKEIMQIKVKNYTMKRDKKKEVLVGVIAQELQKVFPNSVSEGRDGYLRIRRDEIFYACINAIKELNEKIQDIIAKITGLDEKIRILEDRNKLNEEKIASLERQNKLFEQRLTALENAKKAETKAAEKLEKKLNKEVEKLENAKNNTEKSEMVE